MVYSIFNLDNEFPITFNQSSKGDYDLVILFTEAFKEWVRWVVKDKCIGNRLFSNKFITYAEVGGGTRPGYEELTCSDLDEIETIMDSLNKDNLSQEDIVNVQDMCKILLNNIC